MLWIGRGIFIVSVLGYCAVYGAAFFEVDSLTNKLLLVSIAIAIMIGAACLNRLRKSINPFIPIAILIAAPAVFALVVVPRVSRRVAALETSSHDARTKGGLNSLRAAAMDYYTKNGGRFPDSLAAYIGEGQPLKAMPVAETRPYHPDSAAVYYGKAANDTGG